MVGCGHTLESRGGVPACCVPLHKTHGCISTAFGDAQVDLALAAQRRQD